MAADCSYAMLEGDIFPQIAPALSIGDALWWQQDLASHRAAAKTKQLLRDSGVARVP